MRHVMGCLWLADIPGDYFQCFPCFLQARMYQKLQDKQQVLDKASPELLQGAAKGSWAALTGCRGPQSCCPGNMITQLS